MHSECYGSWVCLSVCVYVRVCVCVCVLVPKLASRMLFMTIQYKQAMQIRRFVGISLKMLHSKVMVLFAYLQHPTAVLQRYIFSATFRWQSFLKLLNATWNTTQCKAVSFFLFSLHLLPTNLLYTFHFRMRISSMCTICKHTPIGHRGFYTSVHSVFLQCHCTQPQYGCEFYASIILSIIDRSKHRA